MKNHYRAWVSNESARTAADELLQQQQHRHHHQQQQQQGEAGSLRKNWQDRGQLQGSAPQQQQQSPEQQQKLPIGVTLLFGGVAGLVAQTVTYPLVSCLHAIQHNLPACPICRSASASGKFCWRCSRCCRSVEFPWCRCKYGPVIVQSHTRQANWKTCLVSWTGCPWLVAFGMLMTFVCWSCCCGTGCHQAADAGGSPPSTASKSY